MDYRLVILKSAANDVSEAYNYYETIKSGLGERFLAERLVRLNDITRHPKYYGFIDVQHIIRDVRLRNFPYLAVYEIEHDAVIFYSIHNGYRHPDKRFEK